jgi:hypothetical protein
LARVAFGLTLAQLFVAWVVPGAAIFFLSLIGQIASGLFGPGFGLRSIVEVDLALAVCLPLLACADSFRFFAVRLLLGVPIGFGTLAVATTHSLWNRYVLTIPGCLLTALVIATSLGLLWLRLRHRYRTCDLIADPGARFA